ncbi:MAG: hypothetical protein GVY22_12865, partial [Gammaproteobacteria bacterium]|nr:hypothetical protein [Gammaproteobacteria bacterium]
MPMFMRMGLLMLWSLLMTITAPGFATESSPEPADGGGHVTIGSTPTDASSRAQARAQEAGAARATGPAESSQELPPLIPREVLFGNPTRTQAQLSPDGAQLSWLAPSADGVLNVWVQPADRSREPRQITDDRKRGIRRYGWSEDGSQVLYLQDVGGDENWHLYATPLDGGKTRDLTPFEGVRAQNLMTDPEHPNELLVGLNRRDPSVFDLYRIRLDSGEVTLDTENPGDVVSWLTDPDFRIRAAEA